MVLWVGGQAGAPLVLQEVELELTCIFSALRVGPQDPGGGAWLPPRKMPPTWGVLYGTHVRQACTPCAVGGVAGGPARSGPRCPLQGSQCSASRPELHGGAGGAARAPPAQRPPCRPAPRRRAVSHGAEGWAGSLPS